MGLGVFVGAGCVFGCLGVWVFGCLGVWVFGCLGVWVFGCLGVWVFGCLGVWGVWVFGCLGVWVFGGGGGEEGTLSLRVSLGFSWDEKSAALAGP